MSGGLTKAQRELLERIATGHTVVAENYPPAKKLVSLGLAGWSVGRWADHLTITSEGRQAVQDRGVSK